MEPNSLYTPDMSFFVEKKSYKFCNLYCLPLYLIGLLPEVVSLAEEEVPLGVERLPHLAQPTVAAAALQAVLVPELVHRLNIHQSSQSSAGQRNAGISSHSQPNLGSRTGICSHGPNQTLSFFAVCFILIVDIRARETISTNR